MKSEHLQITHVGYKTEEWTDHQHEIKIHVSTTP